jgi:formate-dependent nitrite reductase membrane component NrfD
MATSYTGFLFAQGLGRDLWQGPSAAVDLAAQSGAAGSASLLIASLLVGTEPGTIAFLGKTLVAAVVAHLVILLFEHVFSPSPTRHHELATHTILKGAYARLFWGAAIIGGGVLPVLILLAVGTTFSPAITAAAALLALAGGAAWEYIWVEAGQSVPLS